jgi:hypothetical protein
VLGVVENMSGLVQRANELRFTYAPAAVADPTVGPNGAAPLDVTQHVLDLLRTQFQDLNNLVIHSDVFTPSGGGAAKMCEDMGVALLGRVPLDPALSLAAEQGRPVFGPLTPEQENGGTAAAIKQPATTAVCLPALQHVVQQVLSRLP